MRWYLVAGEASGDLHGARLLEELYAGDPAATVRFRGGPLMDAVYRAHENGDGFAHDYAEDAVMGVSDVLRHAGRLLRSIREGERDLLAWAPDAVILIDYPGYNLHIAKFAHTHGIKVFYYIAPKVWASRERRVRLLRQYVDRLFIVFPFEQEYFAARGVPYTYMGNPLLDEMDPALPRAELLEAAGLEDRPFVALLAGSRRSEVRTTLPVCAALADRLHALPAYRDWQFVIAGAPSRDPAEYAPWIEGRESYLKLVFGQTQGILRHAGAAVINSGTASLEACLTATPQVVVYSTSRLNYFLAKRLVRVPYISLGNLILGRQAFRELIQDDFSPAPLEAEVRRLIEDPGYRAAMLADYAEIQKRLGGAGASAAVAAEMIRLV